MPTYTRRWGNEERDIMSEDVFKKDIRKGHIFYESGNSFFW